MDATAGLLAGFPVAAQSAVLPLPRRNGEQVTIEEYAEEMLSCTVPGRRRKDLRIPRKLLQSGRMAERQGLG